MAVHQSYTPEGLYGHTPELGQTFVMSTEVKRFVGRAAVVVGIATGMISTNALSGGHEAAATGGYPEATVPDCSAIYGIYSWCKPGDDWISPRGYGYRNCTDWVAFRIPQLVQKNVPWGWGNGGNWDNAANSAGYHVDSIPEPGDIAVWDPSGPGKFGHVEVVESVNPNGTVNTSGYNKHTDGNYDTQSGIIAHHYIDLNGSGVGINGESTNPQQPPEITDRIDELGFVRTNHASGRTELVTWHGAPSYTTLRTAALTGYPTVGDPENITPLAIDVNGDGIDELGLVRTNHSSGNSEISLWHGSPDYATHLATTLTSYPAVSDPENVTPLAIDVNGDDIDELGFVRTNHSSGHSELVVLHGAPHYTTIHTHTLTGYPAIADPANVTPIAIDVNGDKIDELGFVRTNHSSGRSELSLWHGAPNYTTQLTTVQTGYPAVSDPENVTPIAIDVNGDKIDELGFVRTNHTSGKTELSLWHGSPYYTTHLVTTLTGYPAVADPQNVTPLAIHLPY